MKKLTKILALALALAMMLGMTSMATTLYLSEDFNYTAYADWHAGITDADGSVATGKNAYCFTNIDFAAARQQNIDKILSGTYLISASTISIVENSNGNKMVSTTQDSYDQAVAYVPSASWDIAGNPTEKYIISYDFSKSNSGIWGNLRSRQWVSGVDSESAYKKVELMNASGATDLYVVKDGEGNQAITHTSNDASRFAYGFYYDAETEAVARTIAEDGAVLATASEDLVGLTSIDAFEYGLHTNAPRVAKLRMYTIDATTGLTATSAMSGAENVLPSQKKVTIVFNQPVGGANFVITADGEEVDGYTTTVREVISEGSIYSEVDIDFAENLSLGTEYVIDLADVTNEIGDACVSDAITFETMAAPEATFTAYEGLKESSTSISEYAGKTVYVKAQVANTTASSFSGNLIIGIYDVSSGALVKYAKATKTVAASETATFAASFKVGAGQTIRAEFK